MREIKFRAINKTNGMFVYGNPITFDENEHIEYCSFYACDKTGHWSVVSIIPSTLGQYTGLKDKNGKEIYEGDVVVAWSQGCRAVGEVKQRIDGLWIMYPAYQKGKMWGLCPNPKGDTSIEIIGNIHENRELLEVHP